MIHVPFCSTCFIYTCILPLCSCGAIIEPLSILFTCLFQFLLLTLAVFITCKLFHICFIDFTCPCDSRYSRTIVHPAVVLVSVVIIYLFMLSGVITFKLFHISFPPTPPPPTAEYKYLFFYWFFHIHHSYLVPPPTTVEYIYNFFHFLSSAAIS